MEYAISIPTPSITEESDNHSVVISTNVNNLTITDDHVLTRITRQNTRIGLQKTQPTCGGAVTVVWQTLCKLCLPLPPPATHRNHISPGPHTSIAVTLAPSHSRSTHIYNTNNSTCITFTATTALTT